MGNTREKLSVSKTHSFNIKFLERLAKLSEKTGISESQLLQRATIKAYPELLPKGIKKSSKDKAKI